MGSATADSTFHWLLNELPDGAYCVDRDRRIAYWNPASERLTGFTRGEVEGKCCGDNILTHMDVEGNNLCLAHCPLAGTMTDGQSRGAHVYLHHKAGHRVPVIVRCSPIRNAEGRIVGGIEFFSDASLYDLLQQRVTELEALAYLDELTGVANRRYTEIACNQSLSEFRRYNWTFGMLLLDIDQFKAINNRFSRAVGDQALRMIAQTLAHDCRAFDLIGRWGNDDFIAIIKHADDVLLTTVAKRFHTLAAGSFIDLGDDGTVTATLSIGATTVRSGDTLDSMLDRLDRNMHASKRRGGNLVTFGNV